MGNLMIPVSFQEEKLCESTELAARLRLQRAVHPLAQCLASQALPVERKKSLKSSPGGRHGLQAGSVFNGRQALSKRSKTWKVENHILSFSNWWFQPL